MPGSISIIVLTTCLIYYKELLGYLISFVLQLLLRVGAVKLVKKKSDSFRKLRKTLLYEGISVNKDDETWSVKTNILPTLLRLHAKSPMIVLKHSKNIIESEKNGSNALRVSVTVSALRIKSVNLSPFVGVKDLLRRKTRTFLLGLSLNHLILDLSIRFEIVNKKDDSIQTVSMQISIKTSSIQLNLFSKGLMVILYQRLKMIWNRLRMKTANFSEESDSSFLATSTSVESVQSEENKKRNSKLYMLNKIIGGAMIKGFSVDAKLNGNENQISDDSTDYVNASCNHSHLRAKRISLTIHAPKFKESSDSGPEKVTLDIKSLQASTLSFNNEDNTTILCKNPQELNINSLSLSICADEDEDNLVCVEVNSGYRHHSHTEDIVILSSGSQVSYLFAMIEKFGSPILRILNSSYNLCNLKVADQSNGMNHKRPGLKIRSVTLSLAAKVTLKDHTFHLAQSSCENEESMVSLELSSHLMAKFNLGGGVNDSKFHLQCAHTKVTHGISSDGNSFHDTTLLEDLEYIIISNETCTRDELCCTNKSEISIGDIVVDGRDEIKNHDTLLLVSSFVRSVSSISNSVNPKSNDSEDKNEKVISDRELILSCGSVNLNLTLYSIEYDTCENRSTMYYSVCSEEILVHKTSCHSDDLSIKIANLVISLGFSPHSSFPTFERTPEKRYCLFEAESSEVDVLLKKDRSSESVTVSIVDLQLLDSMNWNPAKNTCAQSNVLLRSNGSIVIRIDKAKGENVISQIISIRTLCPEFKILWSPIFQWYLASSIQRTVNSLFWSSRNNQFESFAKRKVINCININTHETLVSARAVLGGMSVADITTQCLSINIINDERDTWDKPSVTVTAGVTSLDLNESNVQVALFQSIRFYNALRRATAEEVDNYCSQRLENDDLEKEIVVGSCGTPLVEMFEILLEKPAQVTLPSLLHLGKIIEDINATQRSTKEGLLEAGFSKENPNKDLRYQLMDVSMKIPTLNVHFLEEEEEAYHNQAHTNGNSKSRSRYGSPCLYESSLERWKFHIIGFDVKIKRHTPPQVTQIQLQNLDEDKSRKYSYGPRVDGGVFYIHFDRVVNTLHPQNLATPLGDISGWDISGLIYLASLDPSTDGLINGSHFCVPVKCHHTNSFTSGSDLCCGCDYTVKSYSRRIPPKIYIDLQLHSEIVHSSYGDIVGRSIPKLMNIINRLIPKPPLEDFRFLREPSSPYLDWWDNLRNQFHGNFVWTMDKISFRWLLDDIIRYDWSILLTAQKFILKHSTGKAKLDLDDVIISVPDSSYHMLNAHNYRSMIPLIKHRMMKTNTNDEFKRSPLISFPKFSTEFDFKWGVKSDDTTRHHSSYMKADVESSTDGDNFHRFRSHGWGINFGFYLNSKKDVENWLALRGDILPWLTHKSIVEREPADLENDIGGGDPLPKVLSLKLHVYASTLNIGAWFDEVSSANHLKFAKENTEGLYFKIPNITYTMAEDGRHLIDISDLRATLLSVYTGRSERKASYLDKKMNKFNWSTLHYPFMIYDISCTHSYVLFKKLQHSAENVPVLEYILFVDKIKILDRSLEDIRSSNHLRNMNEAQWSVLLARMKLLWTVVIRDSVLSIVKDILFAINFMTVNSRGTPQLLEAQKDHNVISTTNTSSDDDTQQSDNDSCNNLSTEDVATNTKSHLSFLLDESEDEVLNYSSRNHVIFKASQDRKKESFISRGVSNTIVPTFNLYLSNPQIQFHSEKTGGSLIIGLHGAYIEARKFLNLFAKEDAFENDDFRLETLLRRTEFLYTLDRLELFSINDNVDVDVGLQWLNLSNAGGESFCGPGGQSCSSDFSVFDIQNFDLPFLCSSIMSPATFKTLQRFHRPPIDLTKEELNKVIEDRFVSSFASEIDQDQRKSIDFLHIVIDELSFHLKSDQFSTTLDVLRNTLLEPLKPRKERYYQQSDQVTETPKYDAKLRSGFKMSDTAQSRVEQALFQWQSEPNVKAKKKWREHLRVLAKHLMVEMEESQNGINEPSIRHIEYSLGTAKWIVAVPDSANDAEIIFTGFKGVHDFTADGSVNSQIGLEDMFVRALRPTSEAMIFEDSSVILKTILGNELSPCQQCGKHFDRSANNASSCLFHPGRYQTSYYWSCCGATDQDARGCESRPHSGIERAIQVRFDALPRRVKGLSMYRHFEANIYPGVPHTIVVQLTKSHAKAFMQYFLGGNSENDILDEDDPSDHDPIGSRNRLESVGDETRRILLFGGVPTKKDMQTRKNSKDTEVENIKVRNQKELGEIIYLKLWRIGDININLSVAGFGRVVDLNEQALVVSSFQRAYKIGPVDHLVRKVLGHLLKDLMSSGLEIIKDKLSGKSKNTPSIQKKQLKGSALEVLKEEGQSDDEHREELLLGAVDSTKAKRLGWFRRNSTANSLK